MDIFFLKRLTSFVLQCTEVHKISIGLRSTEEFDFFFKMKNVAVNLAQIETKETLNLSSLLGKVGLCYDTSSSDLRKGG